MSNAASRIVDALTSDISQGRLAPGARLDESRLATRFGVSRTPVREALNHLIARQVLCDRGRRGVTVTEIGRDDLAQMFEAMCEIEALCAKLAAQRMSLLMRAQLDAAHHRCLALAEAGDVDGYLAANEAFHRVIYRGTQNRFVEEMAWSFRERTGPFRASKFRTREDLLRSVEDHAEIVTSINGAQSEAAQNGMRRHMTASHMRILTEDAAGTVAEPTDG